MTLSLNSPQDPVRFTKNTSKQGGRASLAALYHPGASSNAMFDRSARGAAFAEPVYTSRMLSPCSGQAGGPTSSSHFRVIRTVYGQVGHRSLSSRVPCLGLAVFADPEIRGSGVRRLNVAASTLYRNLPGGRSAVAIGNSPACGPRWCVGQRVGAGTVRKPHVGVRQFN